MYPFLISGDIITSEKREPRIGDIIIFKRDGANIVHRVINIINGSFITKGDNIDEIDNRIVKSKDIIGVVRGINNKKVSKLLNRLIAILSYYNLTPGPLKRKIFNILRPFESNLRKYIMTLFKNRIRYVIYKRGNIIEIKALFKNKPVGKVVYKDNLVESIWIRRLYRNIGIESKILNISKYQ